MEEIKDKFIYPDGSFVSFVQIKGSYPAVLYLHGTQSSVNSTKALFVKEYCKAKNIAFTALDFRGHGNSSGKYVESNVSMWLADALNILDNKTVGPQILVGSSMGGWIMIMLAMRRPDRVKAMLGLAAAPDFTAEIWNNLPEKIKQKLKNDGIIYLPSEYSKEGEPITYDLIKDGYNNLILNRKIKINAKTILLHGDKDTCVPFTTAEKIKECIGENNVKLVKVHNGNHNLSTEEQLKILQTSLDELRTNIQ